MDFRFSGVKLMHNFNDNLHLLFTYFLTFRLIRSHLEAFSEHGAAIDFQKVYYYLRLLAV